MPRRSLVPIAVIACALAAFPAGCGGGSDDEGSGVSPEALEKVAASDYARAVNLRQSDVPYFEVLPDDGDEVDPEAEERREREAERCIGLKGPNVEPLAEVSSPTFGINGPPEGITVESSVTVELASVDVAGEIRRFRGGRAIECMRKLFLGNLKEQEETEIDADSVTAELLPFPGPEIEGSYAFRFKAAFRLSEDTTETVAYRPAATPKADDTLDAYVDLLGFPVGQTVVTFGAIGIPSPVSKIFEANLVRVLHERATSRSP